MKYRSYVTAPKLYPICTSYISYYLANILSGSQTVYKNDGHSFDTSFSGVLFSTPSLTFVFVIILKHTWLISSGNETENFWIGLTSLHESLTALEPVLLYICRVIVGNQFRIDLPLSKIFMKNLKNRLPANVQPILHRSFNGFWALVHEIFELFPVFEKYTAATPWNMKVLTSFTESSYSAVPKLSRFRAPFVLQQFFSRRP